MRGRSVTPLERRRPRKTLKRLPAPRPMAERPDWTAFDATDAPQLPELAERPGRIVVVLATEEAQRDGWALAATLDLARAWGREGHKIVVADALLERPALHALLGVTNGEGVSDTVLYGSSVRRVAKPAPQGAFFFITAGSPVADPAQILASERWSRLCSGFVEAGVGLMVFIDDAAAGLSEALAAATDVVLFAGPDEDTSPLLSGVDAAVCCVCGPPPPPPVEDHAENAIFEAVRDGEGLPAAEADILALAGGAKKRSTRGPVVLVLGAIILGIVVAATFDLIPIPGIAPSTRRPPPRPAEVATPVATSIPFAESTRRMSFSVAVGAFQDATVAEARATALASVSGVMLVVVPVSIDGTLFHRVLIDAAEDEAGAEALADRVANESGADRSSWMVRATGVAFEVGESADLDAANRRVQVLKELDVQAYAVALDFANGTTRYRVYAGAYADEQEAEYLRSHLEERGLGRLTLSDRLGRIPE